MNKSGRDIIAALMSGVHDEFIVAVNQPAVSVPIN